MFTRSAFACLRRLAKTTGLRTADEHAPARFPEVFQPTRFTDHLGGNLLALCLRTEEELRLVGFSSAQLAHERGTPDYANVLIARDEPETELPLGPESRLDLIRHLVTWCDHAVVSMIAAEPGSLDRALTLCLRHAGPRRPPIGTIPPMAVIAQVALSLAWQGKRLNRETPVAVR